VELALLMVSDYSRQGFAHQMICDWASAAACWRNVVLV